MSPKPETRYTCKECGLPVDRKSDGEFARGCECEGGIVALLSAIATGEAKVAQGSAA